MIKQIIIFVLLAIVVCGCDKKIKPTTGTRSYYAKDRYLIAYVHGEYIGDCFIPFSNVSQWLTQEQMDRIVLIETVPDKEDVKKSNFKEFMGWE